MADLIFRLRMFAFARARRAKIAAGAIFPFLARRLGVGVLGAISFLGFYFSELLRDFLKVIPKPLFRFDVLFSYFY
jgi:hypothetical protein